VVEEGLVNVGSIYQARCFYDLRILQIALCSQPALIM
jgi:hypothetical protein